MISILQSCSKLGLQYCTLKCNILKYIIYFHVTGKLVHAGECNPFMTSAAMIKSEQLDVGVNNFAFFFKLLTCKLFNRTHWLIILGILQFQGVTTDVSSTIPAHFLCFKMHKQKDTSHKLVQLSNVLSMQLVLYIASPKIVLFKMIKLSTYRGFIYAKEWFEFT